MASTIQCGALLGSPGKAPERTRLTDTQNQEGLSPSEISAKLEIEKSTVGRLIDRVERSGWSTAVRLAALGARPGVAHSARKQRISLSVFFTPSQ
jgi:transposase